MQLNIDLKTFLQQKPTEMQTLWNSKIPKKI